MDKFEEFGKRIDEELECVKSFVKEEVAPETEKRTAQFLREVSEKLTEAAAWIEARNAARNAQNDQRPPAAQRANRSPIAANRLPRSLQRRPRKLLRQRNALPTLMLPRCHPRLRRPRSATNPLPCLRPPVTRRKATLPGMACRFTGDTLRMARSTTCINSPRRTARCHLKPWY